MFITGPRARDLARDFDRDLARDFDRDFDRDLAHFDRWIVKRLTNNYIFTLLQRLP